MRMSARKIAVLTLAALAVMALLVGCGGKATTPAGETPAAQATTAQQAPAQPTPVPPTATPAPTQAVSAPTETPQAVEDVSKVPWLKSYRMRMTIETSGEAYADQQSSKLEMVGEFVKEPPAVRYIITGATPEDSMEMIQIGNQSWIKMGNSWMQSSQETAPNFDEQFMIFHPEQLTAGWETATKIGKEKVNGIDTTHYRFDKPTFLQFMLDEETRAKYENLDVAQIDIYLADEGYIVKMVTHMAGKGVEESKPDLAGELKSTFEVYDLNAPIEITAPEVPSVTEGLGFTIPEPAGAKQAWAQEGMVMYNVSGMTLAEAVEFYKKGFTDQGLKYIEDSSTTTDTFATLEFQGEKAKVSVMISPDQNTGTLTAVFTIEKSE
jgi:hypothetical protein